MYRPHYPYFYFCSRRMDELHQHFFSRGLSCIPRGQGQGQRTKGYHPSAFFRCFKFRLIFFISPPFLCSTNPPPSSSSFLPSEQVLFLSLPPSYATVSLIFITLQDFSSCPYENTSLRYFGLYQHGQSLLFHFLVNTSSHAKGDYYFS